jgi:hypothetical protein
MSMSRLRLACLLTLLLCALLMSGMAYQEGVIERQDQLIKLLWNDCRIQGIVPPTLH